MISVMIKGGSFLTNTLPSEDIFTPEDINVNQKLIANIVTEFLKGEIEPQIKELEAKAEGLMESLLKKSAAMGWLGIDIPKEFGGLGLDISTSMIVTEKIALGGPFAIANFTHTAFGTFPILYFGNDEQKRRYLPDLAKGKKIGSFALTEPDMGSDALNVKTVAQLSKDEKDYVLNGQKQFISNAGFADVFVTYAKVDGEKFTAFIMDRDSKGLSFGKEEDKMGILGASTRSVTMENVKVPAQNLLFQLGEGHVVAFNTLNLGRFKLGAASVGMAKLAFEDSIRYAKNRVQFGQPISNFGLIKEKIGEMAIRIFVGESIVYRTSKLLEDVLKNIKTSEESRFELGSRIEEYAIECSISKIYASEMLGFVADEAVQIHGGYGFMKDYPVERYYRDARIYRIFGGTNEINRLLLLRRLMREATEDRFNLIGVLEKIAIEPLNTSGTFYYQKNELADLFRFLRDAKRITLYLLGLVCRAYPNDFGSHQELIRMISNMIIEVFAVESIVLRTQKIDKKLGEEKSMITKAISMVYILEASMRIERWAKLVVGVISEGQMLQNNLSAIKTLTQFVPIDSIAIRRQIADFMLRANRYFIA